LETIGHQIPMNGNPTLSLLLIVNPLATQGWQALFRTHPPTAARIRRLMEVATQQQSPAIA
jgi:heat shock protein HtpX